MSNKHDNSVDTYAITVANGLGDILKSRTSINTALQQAIIGSLSEGNFGYVQAILRKIAQKKLSKDLHAEANKIRAYLYMGLGAVRHWQAKNDSEGYLLDLENALFAWDDFGECDEETGEPVRSFAWHGMPSDRTKILAQSKNGLFRFPYWKTYKGTKKVSKPIAEQAKALLDKLEALKIKDAATHIAALRKLIA